MLPSHTFLTYEDNHKYYWFEHSWGSYKGIHEYESQMSLLLDIVDLFKKEYVNTNQEVDVYLYEYQQPQYHLGCNEFYHYIETQELIKLS